jgi:hypothetical protein
LKWETQGFIVGF